MASLHLPMPSLLLLLLLASWAASPAAADGNRSATPWHPCPWPILPIVASHFNVDCATLRVPLDYACLNGERIDHHVTRVRQLPLSPPVAQVWMLNGGPGTPGEWFLEMFTNPSFTLPVSLEVMLPDHRGTGLSSELACPDGSQNITRTCITAVAADRRVRHFTVSNAARDLNQSLAVLRGSAPVFLLGTSYGSLLLNRFLTIFPKPPIAGAILDSLVDPTFPHFYLYDVEATQVGDEFLLWASASSDCAALWDKQNKDAAEAAHELLRKIAAGNERCVARHFPYLSGSLGAKRLRNYVFLSSILQATNYYTRLVLPAVVYRLLRCQPSDVQALATYFAKIPELRGGSSPLSPLLPAFMRQSMVLNALIHLSEDFHPWRIPSPEVLEALEPRLTFSTEAPVRIARYYQQGFPTYQTDRYYNVLANPSVPVLVLNGDLDAATLVSYVEKVVAQRPDWYFSPLPNVGHSPSSMVMFGNNCISRALFSFMAKPDVDPFIDWDCDPELPRDLDCQATTSRGAQLAREYFNASSLY